MSVEYQVVMADDRVRFCDKVEAHIRVGFVCQGGVYFGPTRHGGWLFMQAMTRITSEEGDPA